MAQTRKNILLAYRRYRFANAALFVAEGRDFSCFLHVRFLHKISIVPHLAIPTLFYWILTDAHTFFLLLRRIFLYLFDLSSDDNLDGDSYSIQNQKKLLTKVAKEKGYDRSGCWE